MVQREKVYSDFYISDFTALLKKIIKRMEQEVFYVGGKKLNVTVKVQVNKGFCKKEKKKPSKKSWLKYWFMIRQIENDHLH